jgi:hypothetical protein
MRVRILSGALNGVPALVENWPRRVDLKVRDTGFGSRASGEFDSHTRHLPIEEHKMNILEWSEKVLTAQKGIKALLQEELQNVLFEPITEDTLAPLCERLKGKFEQLELDSVIADSRSLWIDNSLDPTLGDNELLLEVFFKVEANDQLWHRIGCTVKPVGVSFEEVVGR